MLLKFAQGYIFLPREKKKNLTNSAKMKEQKRKKTLNLTLRDFFTISNNHKRLNLLHQEVPKQSEKHATFFFYCIYYKIKCIAQTMTNGGHRVNKLFRYLCSHRYLSLVNRVIDRRRGNIPRSSSPNVLTLST